MIYFLSRQNHDILAWQKLGKIKLKEGENVMRILITLRRNRTRRYLINLVTKSLISKVRNLIGDQEYSKAVDLVYSEGILVREVLNEEFPALEADLMLSDNYARWDFTK